MISFKFFESAGVSPLNNNLMNNPCLSKKNTISGVGESVMNLIGEKDNHKIFGMGETI